MHHPSGGENRLQLAAPNSLVVTAALPAQTVAGEADRKRGIALERKQWCNVCPPVGVSPCSMDEEQALSLLGLPQCVLLRSGLPYKVVDAAATHLDEVPATGVQDGLGEPRGWWW
jgi:hypothetical protein